MMRTYKAITNCSRYGKIRIVLTDDGGIYYSSTDVARAMGYRSPRDAVQRRCGDDIETFYHRAGTGIQNMNFIGLLDVCLFLIGMPTERALKVFGWLTRELPPFLGEAAKGNKLPRFLKYEGTFWYSRESDPYPQNMLFYLQQAMARDAKAKKEGGAHGRTPAVHEG